MAEPGKKNKSEPGKKFGESESRWKPSWIAEKMKSQESDLGLKYLGSQSQKKFELLESHKKISRSWGKTCRFSSHLKQA